MKYKAKPSYKDLSDSVNFLSLGMASKHIWLIEGMVITTNATLPKELTKHLDEVKEKGDK